MPMCPGMHYRRRRRGTSLYDNGEDSERATVTSPLFVIVEAEGKIDLTIIPGFLYPGGGGGGRFFARGP